MRDNKLYKWQTKLLKELKCRFKNFSDKELLAETIYSAQGDDYDGGFTKEGEFIFEQLKTELDKRLPKRFKGFDNV